MASLTIEDNSNTDTIEESKKKLEVKDYHSKLFKCFSDLESNDKELKNLELEYIENKKRLLSAKKKYTEIFLLLKKNYQNYLLMKLIKLENRKGIIMVTTKVEL